MIAKSSDLYFNIGLRFVDAQDCYHLLKYVIIFIINRERFEYVYTYIRVT
jgi:hypothetical protein